MYQPPVLSFVPGAPAAACPGDGRIRMGERPVASMSESEAGERAAPLYLWLAALLRDEIESGRLPAHAPVPSERVLSERYDVSRMTARHALQMLSLEGYVYRDARRGTFVAEPRLRFTVGSFTRVMTAGDNVPGCEVISAATITPDSRISEALRLGEHDSIHLIRRLRSARARPMAIENIHLSAARFPGLLRFDLTGSLWEIFATHYGVRPAKADARVVAVALDRFEARALQAKTGRPAIALTRTVYDSAGEVIELARDVYCGDRAEFTVTAPVDRT